MDDALTKTILITEIELLLKSLEDRGTSFETVPHTKGELDKFSSTDLRSLKSDLRDLVRTLGGNRI
jgi:hypothetical protein